MIRVHHRNVASRSQIIPHADAGDEKGNILVLGIGAWFIILALAFAIMAAADLYSDKRDVAAEADYIALSLADDLDDSRYYGDGNDFRLSEAELLRRARELARYDSDIMQATSLADGSVYIQVKRTVTVFAIPVLTDVATVDIYGSSTAYLREYSTP